MSKVKFAGSVHAAIIACALAATAILPPSHAQDLRKEIETVVRDYIQRNPQDIQQIVKDYLANNPEVLQQIVADALKKQRPQPARATPAEKVAAIKENASAIFSSPRQATLGNRSGDVTLVEFFDYSCGFCKRSLADKLELLGSDPKLKIVLKDLPILGPNSVEAAKIAVAARMQDDGGPKYLDFHKRLLGDRLPPTRERALAAAKDAGLDVAKITQDESSDEVRATIEENARLARALGINGTPSYVVGTNVLVGAVGIAALRDRIAESRR